MENKKPNTLDVEIQDLAFGGDGVARIEGKACFVPFTLPGDICRIRIRESKKNFMRGRLVEVLTPAQDRIKHKCSVFGHCGGCQYQHMSYAAECRFKETQVRETMRRLGGMTEPPMQPLIPSPKPYGYRNRIQVHIEQGKVGFRAGDGQSLVAIRECPIASEQINKQLRELKPDDIRGQRKLALSDDDTTAAGFSQVNRYQNDALLNLIRKAFAAAQGRLIELYAGSGFFTAALQQQFNSIAVVEWDSRLVEKGRQSCPDVEWFHESVEEAAAKLNWSGGEGARGEKSESAELSILVDPPREGIAANALAAIKSSGAVRLVYLSCNPATQARDLKQLAPEWTVTELTPIDLFPRTAHIENLAVCVRRG
jgi:23S rRNA (uracil1939-C5)-methyltransferase